MAEELPNRTTRRYERVTDFLEPDFNANSVDAHLKARDQRIREYAVATEDFKDLQRQLSECYFKSGPYEHVKACQPLAREVLRRMKCFRFNCDGGVFSQPYKYKQHAWYNAGQDTDTVYQNKADARDNHIAAELEKKAAHSSSSSHH